MSVKAFDNFITGIFIKELKNRFLAEVKINDESEVCYVPSSCHLSNFLDLSGKTVFLVPNKSNSSRTQYALFAIPYKKNYIVLNTSMANRAIENCISQRRFSYIGRRKTVVKEKVIDGYKSDLYIEDSNSIIEIKSVLSIEQIAKFPTVFSERTITQLDQIRNMLHNGRKVFYIIVSLNPYVTGIALDTTSRFYDSLMECIDLGLVIKGYSASFYDSKMLIKKEIPLLY